MKRILKLFFVAVLILGIVSCNSNSNDTNSDHALSDTPTIEETGLLVNMSLGIQDTTEDGYETHETKLISREAYPHLDNWYDLIEEKYNVKIKINYISTMHTQNVITGQYYIEGIASGKITGLILLENGYHNALAAMRNANVIIPMNEYLESNVIYKTLPEEMKYAYRYADGEIWALPAEYNCTIFARYYRKDWLTALNKDVPRNLDELYDLVKAITYSDPDGDGNNNEKGMNGMYYAGAGMFGDIFLANDCYMSNSFNTPIAYDHSTGAYEDAALKPEMKTTLNYIKNFIDESLLELSPNYNFLSSENTGNFYMRNTLVHDRYQWEAGYSLSSEKHHSVAIEKPNRYFVLAGSTENPQETIDSLLKIFYSEPRGILLGRYGIEGTSYTLSDDKLTPNAPPYMGLVGEMPHISEGLIKKDEAERYANIREMAYKNMLVSDIIFFNRKDKLSMQMLFTNLMVERFLGIYDAVSVDDFINAYLIGMKKAGGQQVLDKLNEEAGTTANYGY